MQSGVTPMPPVAWTGCVCMKVHKVPQLETPWGTSFPLKIDPSKMFCRNRRILAEFLCLYFYQPGLSLRNLWGGLPQGTGIPKNQVYALWTVVHFPEWPAGHGPGLWRKAVDRDRAVQERGWEVRQMWIGQHWEAEDKTSAICHIHNNWREFQCSFQSSCPAS